MLPGETAYKYQTISTLKVTILNVMQNSLSQNNSIKQILKKQRFKNDWKLDKISNPNARKATSERSKQRIEQNIAQIYPDFCIFTE